MGVLIGLIWYRLRLPPLTFIKKIYIENTNSYKNFDSIPSYEDAQLTYSKYKKGVPLFLDRSYSDAIGDNKLEELYLIQINRHENKNIIINTKSPITIYRLVPKGNAGLKHSYEKTNIKVMVKGVSSNHIRVVKKTFKSGSIILSPGGPNSSAPILFSIYGKEFPNILFEKTN